jgi:hypothetical protein
MQGCGMSSRCVVVVSFLVACGGSSESGGPGGDVTPFVGMYATTSHTRVEVFGDHVKCADPAAPVASAAPFIRLAVDTFFMDPDILSVSDCADAAGTSCEETLVTLHAGGPGLEEESAESQTGGGLCQLRFTRAQATLTGATVQIESLERYDAPALSSNDCTLQRAKALASSPDCRSVERWTGTRQ